MNGKGNSTDCRSGFVTWATIDREALNPVSLIEGRSFDMEPCTTRERHSERCQSPLCSNPVEPIVNGWRRTERRFCCAQCRQDASLIRRVAKLLDGKSDQEKLSVLKSDCSSVI